MLKDAILRYKWYALGSFLWLLGLLQVVSCNHIILNLC